MNPRNTQPTGWAAELMARLQDATPVEQWQKPTVALPIFQAALKDFKKAILEEAAQTCVSTMQKNIRKRDKLAKQKASKEQIKTWDEKANTAEYLADDIRKLSN